MKTEIARGALLGISHILTNAPYFILACALFWRQRRFAPLPTALVFGAFVFAYGVTDFLLTGFYTGDVRWLPIQLIVFVIDVLALLLLMFRVNFARVLYCFLLLRAVYTAILYIVMDCFRFALPGQYIGFDETPLYTLATVLAIAAVFPFLWRYFTGRLRDVFSEPSDGTIRQLCVPPVLFFLLDQFYSVIRNTLEYDSLQTSVIFLFMLLTGLATYYVNLRMVMDSARQSRLATEAKIKEQALVADNAALEILNRTKTEFLQDMSHEMKAPLTVIATGIDYADRQIKKENGDLAEASGALEAIGEETQRLGRMVGSMVHLVSMSEISENRKRVNLALQLQNSTEVFRSALERHNNRLTVKIAPGLPDVFVENDRFVQVIANLFSNATDSTQNGQITILADFDSRFITVQVTDTGDGIEPELLSRVFNRGVSGRGGTGYGLYICKTIVEAHGGTIKIESVLSKGTTVTFTVPVYGGQKAGHKL